MTLYQFHYKSYRETVFPLSRDDSEVLAFMGGVLLNVRFSFFHGGS